MITHKHTFTEEEMKEMMKVAETNDPEVALEDWAYNTYAMRWCADYFVGKIGDDWVEVIEQ